jgi:hypothetical protein
MGKIGLCIKRKNELIIFPKMNQKIKEIVEKQAVLDYQKDMILLQQELLERVNNGI